jgi:hypothetical protein
MYHNIFFPKKLLYFHLLQLLLVILLMVMLRDKTGRRCSVGTASARRKKCRSIMKSRFNNLGLGSCLSNAADKCLLFMFTGDNEW